MSTDPNKKDSSNTITKAQHESEMEELRVTIRVLKERISELEEIERKTIEEFSFRNASAMVEKSQPLSTPEKLYFPADKLSKFFLDARNCKKQMSLILSADNANVSGWEVE